MIVALDKIRESAGAFSHGIARVIYLRRRVPQNIKLEVGCRALVGVLKVIQTRAHDFLRNGQRSFRVTRIAARPKLPPDLEAGNFAAGSGRIVIVAALKHGKRRPAIHRRGSYGKPTKGQNQH